MRTIIKVQISDRPNMKKRIGKKTTFFSTSNQAPDLIEVILDSEGWKFYENSTVEFVGYNS